MRHLSCILGSYSIGRYGEQEALIVSAAMMVLNHNRHHSQDSIPVPTITEEEDEPLPNQGKAPTGSGVIQYFMRFKFRTTSTTQLQNSVTD